MKEIKITWTDTEKTVPGLGLMETGETYLVDENIGNNLINQGQAKKARKTRTKKGV